MEGITSVLMVGVGGQGIILASDIMTRAALEAGYDAKKSEIHGMSQRGGSVFSHVRFGSKVHSPVIPQQGADVLVSLEEMETARWLSYVSEDTNLILTRQRILPANMTEYPEGIEAEIRKHYPKVIVVEPEVVKQHTGSAKFLNVALLGVVSRFVAIPESAWEAAIQAEVPAGTFESNVNAFRIGKNLQE